MMGAIKRALASQFKPGHEKPCGSRAAEPVKAPSFAQYRRMSDSFQFNEAALPWNSEQKSSSSLPMPPLKTDALPQAATAAKASDPDGLFAPLKSLRGLGPRAEEL